MSSFAKMTEEEKKACHGSSKKRTDQEWDAESGGRPWKIRRIKIKEQVLTVSDNCNIVYSDDKYTILHSGGETVEIIISSNTNKPIYEQITEQIKAMVMCGELKNGDPIPSMRALAKSPACQCDHRAKGI